MVNIFIIVPDLQRTAELLDRSRLGKQRLEALQIINCLTEYDSTGTITRGWKNHPATKSWIGFTNHLKVYFNVITREWIKRGYLNTMPLYEIDETPYHIVQCGFNGTSIIFDPNQFNSYSFPFWVSFYPFYMSNQASLCRKDPKHYSFLLRDELKPFLNHGYFWPCNVSLNVYTSWDFSSHEKLACGTPAVYRINFVDVLRWLSNSNVNPKTGKPISNTSAIHRDYQEAMKSHFIHPDGDIIFHKQVPFCDFNELAEVINSLSNMQIPSVDFLVYNFAFNEAEVPFAN